MRGKTMNPAALWHLVLVGLVLASGCARPERLPDGPPGGVAAPVPPTVIVVVPAQPSAAAPAPAPPELPVTAVAPLQVVTPAPPAAPTTVVFAPRTDIVVVPALRRPPIHVRRPPPRTRVVFVGPPGAFDGGPRAARDEARERPPRGHRHERVRPKPVGPGARKAPAKPMKPAKPSKPAKAVPKKGRPKPRKPAR
jgi:hypothetical protein